MLASMRTRVHRTASRRRWKPCLMPQPTVRSYTMCHTESYAEGAAAIMRAVRSVPLACLTCAARCRVAISRDEDAVLKHINLSGEHGWQTYTTTLPSAHTICSVSLKLSSSCGVCSQTLECTQDHLCVAIHRRIIYPFHPPGDIIGTLTRAARCAVQRPSRSKWPSLSALILSTKYLL
jgi:hypothetical protein